jgi:hypothetical protein
MVPIAGKKTGKWISLNLVDVKSKLTQNESGSAVVYGSQVQQPARIDAILSGTICELGQRPATRPEPTVRDEEASACQPRARTGRKSGTLRCSQRPSKPALARETADGHWPQNELLSSSSVGGRSHEAGRYLAHEPCRARPDDRLCRPAQPGLVLGCRTALSS